MCPVERSRVLNPVAERLTVQKEVLDIVTVESKSSKDFHDVSFTFGWFEIFQVFYSFCNGLDSFWGYIVTKKFNFLYKKEGFVGSCFETCHPKKGMVLVWWQWTSRYSSVTALLFHRCRRLLAFFDERVEMTCHWSAEKIWESAQAIESTCVGVLLSTDYETSYFLCFWAQGNLIIGTREISYW